jgi:hypothetical protein
MRALVILTLLVAACGGDGKCASDFNGHWVGTTLTDAVDIGANCEFQYTGVGGCKSSGTYAAPIAGQGTVKVSIDTSTGGLCLPAGDYVCAYSVSPTTFTFNCGSGTASYSR